MQKSGIQNITILSGDNESIVAKVVQKAGIKKYLAQCSPQDKLSWLRLQQKQGGCVLFIGDGINDA